MILSFPFSIIWHCRVLCVKLEIYIPRVQNFLDSCAISEVLILLLAAPLMIWRTSSLYSWHTRNHQTLCCMCIFIPLIAWIRNSLILSRLILLWAFFYSYIIYINSHNNNVRQCAPDWLTNNIRLFSSSKSCEYVWTAFKIHFASD